MYGYPFGGPAFYHSEVTNEAAKNSPTVALVRYLIDAAHDTLPADNIASHATSKVLLNAHNWLKVADEDLIDEDYNDEVNPPVLEQAAPVIADLTGLIPGVLAVHSIVVNWSDRDPEQGTYGATVRAWDHEHAEYLARAEMEMNEDHGDDLTGSIVDHNVGATWRAADLEEALRNLAAYARTVSVGHGHDMPDALRKAEQLLAEIDAI